jgi:hypothetical protein
MLDRLQDIVDAQSSDSSPIGARYLISLGGPRPLCLLSIVSSTKEHSSHFHDCYSSPRASDEQLHFFT